MKTPDSFTPFSSISLAEFEQVNVSWVHNEKKKNFREYFVCVQIDTGNSLYEALRVTNGILKSAT